MLRRTRLRPFRVRGLHGEADRKAGCGNPPSGLMSGEGKRSVAVWPKSPRPSSTLHIGPSFARSVRLRARELYHLRPFLGFVGQEFAELGRRAGNDLGTEVAEPRLCLRST